MASRRSLPYPAPAGSERSLFGEDVTIDVLSVANILMRRKWLIGMVTALGTALAAVVGMNITPEYTSRDVGDDRPAAAAGHRHRAGPHRADRRRRDHGDAYRPPAVARLRQAGHDRPEAVRRSRVQQGAGGRESTVPAFLEPIVRPRHPPAQSVADRDRPREPAGAGAGERGAGDRAREGDRQLPEERGLYERRHLLPDPDRLHLRGSRRSPR